jgi:hypothetical protein
MARLLKLPTNKKLVPAIPCHQRLREILTALPRGQSEFILTGKRGHEYKADILIRLVRNQLAKIGIRGYSVHGLRSNAALAEASCSRTCAALRQACREEETCP